MAKEWHQKSQQRSESGMEEAQSTLALISASKKLSELGNILGLELGGDSLKITPQQQEKIECREQARKRGDFTKADKLRSELLKEGIVLEDAPQGNTVARRVR